MAFNKNHSNIHPYIGRGILPYQQTDNSRFEENAEVGNVAFGDNPPPYISNTFDGTNVRSIGMRSPQILVGWGFDLQGRPVPNISPISGQMPLSGLNPNYQIGGELNQNQDDTDIVNGIANRNNKFINNIPSGAMINPNDYIAAPLDVKYDYRNGVWSTDNEFLAEVIGYSSIVLDDNRRRISYIIREVNVNRSGIPQLYENSFYNCNHYNSNIARNSSQTASNYSTTFHGAFNLSQLDQPPFNIIPSGTVVEVKARRGYNQSNSISDVFYTFRYEMPNYFWATITSYQENNLDGDINSYPLISTIPNYKLSKWIYGFQIKAPGRSITIDGESFDNPGNPGLLDYLNIGNANNEQLFGDHPFISAINTEIPTNRVAFNLYELSHQESTANDPATNSNWSGEVSLGISAENIPEGFSLKPIADGTYVQIFYEKLTDGQYLFWFSAPNAIDGECVNP